MPYIPKERREAINEGLVFPATIGELNYTITKTILDYMSVTYQPPWHYRDYNEIIGMIECVKQEFYRRLVAEHEDSKKAEEGDVF